MSKEIKKAAVMSVFLIVLSLLGLSAFVAADSVFSQPTKPNITSVSVLPEKVIPGDLMTVKARVEDENGIKNITAEMPHELGSDLINLTLKNGSVYQGKWKGNWTVHDTEVKDYTTTITATNEYGKSSQEKITWKDPTTYSFTTCGATGRYGPSQSDCDSAYSGTNLDGEVNVVGNGIQEWNVPSTGNYKIEAAGAKGRDNYDAGGEGAIVSGKFDLQGGTTLSILVGQRGGQAYSCGGGGGGSFVVSTGSYSSAVESDILIITGAGGGSTGNNYVGYDGQPGQGNTYGSGGGGTAYSTSNEDGCGGGGFQGDGGDLDWADGGNAFVNGGAGGSSAQNGWGGFGGGGACSSDGGGGGGGYTGGDGGYYDDYQPKGGASYVNSSATGVSRQDGGETGHGYVDITKLNAPPNSPSSPSPGNDTTIESTSPTLSAHVSDPEGDQMDVKFYEGSPHSKSVIFSEDWDDGNADGWSTYYNCGEGGVAGTLDNHPGISTRGSHSMRILGTGSISHSMDLSGYTDVTVSFWRAIHSFDDSSCSCENARFDFYDGSSWHNGVKHKCLNGDLGWEEVSYDVPNNWLSSNNKIRFKLYDSGGCGGCCCGDYYYVDDIEVKGYTSNGLIGEDTGVSSGNRASATWSGLNEGQSYDWGVTAEDTSGASTTSPTWTFTVDMENPSVTIDNPQSQPNYNYSSIDINVTASDQYSSVNTVLAQINQTENVTLAEDGLAQDGTIWYNDTYTFADGENTVKIFANDSVDNWNNTQTVTFDVDTDDPSTATVTAPSNGSYYNSSTMPDRFSGDVADDPDGLGVYADSSELYIKNTSGGYWDGGSWSDSKVWLQTTHSSTTGGGSTSWSLGSLPSWGMGKYYVKVKAKDRAGNVNKSSEKYFYYDDENPSVSSPSINDSVVQSSGGLRINVTITDDYINESEIYVKNSSKASMDPVGNSNVFTADTTPSDLDCPSDSECLLTFIAKDKAGNVNDTTTTSVTVDDDRPDIAINHPSEGQTVRVDSTGHHWVNGTINDGNREDNDPSINDSRYVLKNYSPSTGEYAFWNISAVPNGEVTIKVNFTDDAGNSNESYRTFIVDNKDPTISFIKPTPKKYEYVGGELRLKANLSDAYGLKNAGLKNATIYIDSLSTQNHTCTFGTNPVEENCSWPGWNSSELEDGNHTIHALAYDDVGNSYSISRNVTTTWRKGWRFRKQLIVNNTQNSNELTEHQVNLSFNTVPLIKSGKLQNGCEDLRFTYWNSTSKEESKISYWVEPGTCNTQDTEVWIKVPRIPASRTKKVWMYYGNVRVGSESNESIVRRHVGDSYSTENKISSKDNVIVNTSLGNVKINNTVWTYGYTSHDIEYDSHPTGIFFQNSSDYWWMTGAGSSAVYKYDTNWNFKIGFDLSNDDSSPQDIYYNGTYWWMVGTDTDKVYRYTSFDSPPEESHSVSDQDGSPTGIFQGSSGNWWMVGDNSDKVYKYDSGWGYTGTNYSVGSEDKSPTGIFQDSSGNWWMVGSQRDRVYRYSSDWSYTGESHDLSNNDLDPQGVHYDGENWWMVGDSSDKVYKYFGFNSFLSSDNLLSNRRVSRVGPFKYNSSSIPSDTSLKVQFSQNNTDWFNSTGAENSWNDLSEGRGTIDLSELGWSSSNFSYRFKFGSKRSETPILDGINLTYWARRTTDPEPNVTPPREREEESFTLLTVMFSSPTAENSSYVMGSQTINVTAESDFDIENITIYHDKLQTETNSYSGMKEASLNTSWDTSKEDDGYLPTYYAKSYDVRGENMLTEERTFIVDNSKPSAEFIDPTPQSGDYVAGTQTIKVNASDAQAGVDKTAGIRRIEIYVNGTKEDTCPYPDTPENVTCKWSWETSEYNAGNYNFSAKVYDDSYNCSGENGNRNKAVTTNVIVDNTKPSLSFLDETPDQGTYIGGERQIKVGLSDNIGLKNATIYIDSLSNQNYTCSLEDECFWRGWNTSELDKGNHTIYALAYDNSGNNYKISRSVITFWWNRWRFRKQVVVNNTQNSNELTDYQANLSVNTASLVSSGRLQSDCEDLRFTYWNNTSENEKKIDYWVEPGTCGSQDTQVWVEVPYIPNKTRDIGYGDGISKIWMYYGDSSAASESNASLLNKWTQNTDSDFSSGSFVNTTVKGSGQDAVVTLQGDTIHPPKGTFNSSSYYTGSSRFVYLSWTENVSASTDIKFQIATNKDNSTWNFVGPGGTSGSYYTSPGQGIYLGHGGDEYVKYKANLSTTDDSVAPELENVTLYYGNYSSPEPNKTKKKQEVYSLLTISFSSPTAESRSYVMGEQVVNVTASSIYNITNMSIYLNGTSQKNRTYENPSSSHLNWTWDTTATGYTDGAKYLFHAEAYDGIDERRVTENRTVWIDNSDPSAEFIDPTPQSGDYVAGTQTIKVNASDAQAGVDKTAGIRRIEIYVNGTKEDTCPYPDTPENVTCKWSWETSEYNAGNYNFSAKVYDDSYNCSGENGNTYERVKTSISVDNTNPDSASVGIPSDGGYYSFIPSEFNGSTGDNTGGVGLRASSTKIYLNNSTHYWNGSSWLALEVWLQTTHSSTSDGSNVTWTYSTLPALSDGVYYIGVNTTDRSGNTRLGSMINFTYDTNKPEVYSPSRNDSILKTDGMIEINITVSDKHINKSEIYVKNSSKVPMRQVGDSNVFTADTTPSDLDCPSNSNCTLTFIAKDRAGNVNDTATVNITTDDTDTPPYILSPDGGENLRDDVNITWDTVGEEHNYTASIEYYNGSDWDIIDGAGNISDDGQYTWGTTGLEGSNFKIRINTTDKAGNTGSNVSDTFTVDNAGPTSEFIPPTPNESAYVGGIVGIKVNASDEIAGVGNITIYVDGQKKKNCTDTICYYKEWNTSSYKEGLHNFSSKIYDKSGNLMTIERNVTTFWWKGWGFRRQIVVNNTGDSKLTDYQLNFTIDTTSLVTKGAIRPGCEDLRFTRWDSASGQESKIPHWVKPGTCGTASTEIWVKVPQVPVDGSRRIWMYYGNLTATQESDSALTFPEEDSVQETFSTSDNVSRDENIVVNTAEEKVKLESFKTSWTVKSEGDWLVYENASDNVKLSNSNLRFKRDMDIAYINTTGYLKYIDSYGNVHNTGRLASDVGDMGKYDDDTDLDLAYINTTGYLNYIDSSGNVGSTGQQASDVGGMGKYDDDTHTDLFYIDSNNNLMYTEFDRSSVSVDTQKDAYEVGGMGNFEPGSNNLEILYVDENSNLWYRNNWKDEDSVSSGFSDLGGTADFNGDGDLDVAYVNTSGYVKYSNVYGNVFNPSGSDIKGKGVGYISDFNSDSDPEIIYVDKNNNLRYIGPSGEVQGTKVDAFSVGGVGNFDSDKSFASWSSSWHDWGANQIYDSLKINVTDLGDGLRAKVEVSHDKQTVNDSTGWIDITSTGSISRDISGLPEARYSRVKFSLMQGSGGPVIKGYKVKGKQYYIGGELSSKNILSNKDFIPRIDHFNYSLSVPSEPCPLKAQFSQDNNTWFSSSGTRAEWDDLSDGAGSLDLSDLDWAGSDFYYRFKFDSGGGNTPSIDNVSVSYGKRNLTTSKPAVRRKKEEALTSPSLAFSKDTASGRGTVIVGGSQTVNVTAKSKFNITNITIYFDGKKNKTCTFSGDSTFEFCNWTWDSTDYGYSSQHKFYSSAYDGLGNYRETENMTVRVDNKNPPIDDVSPSGRYIKDSIQITWNHDESGPYQDTANIEYYHNGKWTSIVQNINDDGSYPWDTGSVPDGSDYKIRVTATDKAGNTGSNQSVSNFTIDNTDPSVTEIEPSGGKLSGSVNITWNTTDNNKNTTKIEYYHKGTWKTINQGQSITGGIYPWDTTSVPDGSDYKIRVTATDKVGRKGQNVSNSIFTIDNTLPSVTDIEPSGGEYISGVTDITWWTEDANKENVSVAFFNGTWNTIAEGIKDKGSYYGWDTSSLEVDSNYKVKVTSTDDVGNVGYKESSQFFIDNKNPEVSHPSRNETILSDGDAAVEINVTVTDVDYRNDSDVYVRNGSSVRMSKVGSTDVFTAHTTPDELGCTELHCKLTFNATDKAGNFNDTTSTYIIADTIHPKYSSLSYSPKVDVDEEETVVRINISDNVNISRVWIKENSTGSFNKSFMNLQSGNSSDALYNYTITYSSTGDVNFQVVMNDTAGNKNSTDNHTLHVQDIFLSSSLAGDSKLNPGENVTVGGTAVLNNPVGDPEVNGRNVSIYLNGTFQTNRTTDYNGEYSYTFPSNKTPGKYILRLNITNSEGIAGENITTFGVYNLTITKLSPGKSSVYRDSSLSVEDNATADSRNPGNLTDVEIEYVFPTIWEIQRYVSDIDNLSSGESGQNNPEWSVDKNTSLGDKIINVTANSSKGISSERNFTVSIWSKSEAEFVNLSEEEIIGKDEDFRIIKANVTDRYNGSALGGINTTLTAYNKDTLNEYDLNASSNESGIVVFNWTVKDEKYGAGKYVLSVMTKHERNRFINSTLTEDIVRPVYLLGIFKLRNYTYHPEDVYRPDFLDVNKSTTINVTLTDKEGLAVNDANVTFRINETVLSCNTDSSGYCNVTYNPPETLESGEEFKPGNYTVRINATKYKDNHPTFKKGQWNRSIIVKGILYFEETSPESGPYIKGLSYWFNSSVNDMIGAGEKPYGNTVWKLNDTVISIGDINNAKIPTGLENGQYVLKAETNRTYYDDAERTLSMVNVNGLANISTLYPSNSSILPNNTINIRAKIVNSTGSPISSMPVEFKIDPSISAIPETTFSEKTNSTGYANYTWDPQEDYITYYISATIEENSTLGYSVSKDQKEITKTSEVDIGKYLYLDDFSMTHDEIWRYGTGGLQDETTFKVNITETSETDKPKPAENVKVKFKIGGNDTESCNTSSDKHCEEDYSPSSTFSVNPGNLTVLITTNVSGWTDVNSLSHLVVRDIFNLNITKPEDDILHRKENTTLRASAEHPYTGNQMNPQVNWTFSGSDINATGKNAYWEIPGDVDLGPGNLTAEAGGEYYKNTNVTQIRYIYDYANVSLSEPYEDKKRYDENVTIVCGVRDSAGSYVGAGYPVEFLQNRTKSIANSTTNKMGRIKYKEWDVPNHLKTYEIGCKIEDNASMYYNASRNYSSKMIQVTDPIKPTVKITSIKPKSADKYENITIAFNATDDIGIDRVQLSVIDPDYNVWRPTFSSVGPGMYEAVFNHTSTEGGYQVKVEANDTTGNESVIRKYFNVKSGGSLLVFPKKEIATNITQGSGQSFQVKVNLTMDENAEDANITASISDYSSPELSVTPSEKNCGSISSGGSCSDNFTVTVESGTSPSPTALGAEFAAEWVHSGNYTKIFNHTRVFVQENPVLTVETGNITSVIDHGDYDYVSFTLNSTGNSRVENYSTTFYEDSLDERWVTLYGGSGNNLYPSDLAEAELQLSVPEGQAAGEYFGNVFFDSENDGNATRRITLPVPEDPTYSIPQSLHKGAIRGKSGELFHIPVENTGNVNFTLRPYFSGDLVGYLNAESIYTRRQQTQYLTVGHDSLEVSPGNYTAVLKLNSTGLEDFADKIPEKNITLNITVVEFDIGMKTSEQTVETIPGNTSILRFNVTLGGDIRTQDQTNNVIYVNSTEAVINNETMKNNVYTINFTIPQKLTDGRHYNLTLKVHDKKLDVDGFKTLENKFRIPDITPPKINSAVVDSTEPGENTTVVVDAQDNNLGGKLKGVDNVSITVKPPEGNASTYYCEIKGSKWKYNLTNLTKSGDYEVVVRAKDPANLTSNVSRDFRVAESFYLQGNFTSPVGKNNTASFEFRDPESGQKFANFSVEGRYNKSMLKGTYDIKIYYSDNVITLRKTNITENTTDFIKLDESDPDILPSPNAEAKIMGLGAKENITCDSSTIMFNYSEYSERKPPGDDFEDMKTARCKDYDYENRECDGEFETVDVSVNKTGEILTLNVSGFSLYTLYYPSEKEEDGEEDTTTDGGGGGGEGALTPEQKSSLEKLASLYDVTVQALNQNFVLEDKKVEVFLDPGESTETSVSMNNPSIRNTALMLNVSDSIKQLVSVPEMFVVSPTSTEDLTFNITAPLHPSKKLYSGEVTLWNNYTERTFRVLIHIGVSAEGKVLTLSVTTESNRLRPGDNITIHSTVNALDFDEEKDVNLTYEIRKSGTDKTINKMERKLSVDGVESLKFDMRVPRDAELGDYVLSGKAEYKVGNKIKKYFAVSQLEISVPILKRKVMGIEVLKMIYYSLLAVFGAAAAYASIRYYISWKESRKRYKAKIYSQSLPTENELGGSGYVGKLADRAKSAYFGLDQIMTHVLVAGATGSGKTVTAQILIEEALEKGKNVIVLDPTAQWSGFLRKCKAGAMINKYSRFGISKKDARSYNGNIRAIDSPEEDIDITDLLQNDEESGNIIIFSLHKLEQKDIESFLVSMIRQVFDANLGERDHLDTLIVFDEVHRLLEKFGGSGEGLNELERGAREFRKWGVGMVLVSQVLSDFPGEVRSNIGTKMQMRTRYKGDLKFYLTKYGKDTVRSIVKEKVGSGMIQNAEYNRGEPYFIDFRPLKHSPHRLNDEELDKYEDYNRKIDKIESKIDKLEEEGEDVFDLRSTLDLTLKNLKKGSFQLVDIYIEELEKRFEE